MVKKSSKRSEVAKKAWRTRKLGAASRQSAKPHRIIRWIKSDGPFDMLGHGVEFLHGELQDRTPVAFLEGFDWRGEGPATIRLLGICPTLLTPDHWSEIIESTRAAVLVFLSDETNLKFSFRHGPIHIIINA